ncbi:MAG: PASTA domain-containing protein [Chloroflexota bacterium]
MRRIASALTVVAASIAIVATALPVVAQEQEYEQYERTAPQPPVEGFTRADGTLILRDQDFCSYLLGSIWGEEELTFKRLIDRSKNQRKARKAAFQPLTDADVLQRCTDVLNAFRLEVPQGDPIAPWARLGPVVPEALADLLPADLLSEPLAQPDPIGDGSRTSGFGDRFSSPFGLSGGTYFVQVDARACESWSGSLRDARDPGVDLGAIDGQAYLYDVQPANYYWDISAPDCDWSVDLVAVDLGPEPTATPKPKAVVPKLFGETWDRLPGASNPEWMPADVARATLLDAGLEVGTCTEQPKPPRTSVWPNRVWQQDPAPGTLLEFGSTVDVWIGQDCDVLKGDRIIVE